MIENDTWRGPYRKLRRRLGLARMALAWESLWPAAWPMVGVAGLFVAVALFDVLPLLPPWLHAAVLAGFASAFGLALWRGLGRFRWPSEEQARRRLERDSGLVHRPLGTLEDTLAGGGKDTMARLLWDEHRRRMAAAIGRVRVALPAPGMAARDPLGLRAGVLLMLVVAVAAARWDAPARLQRALTPPVPGVAAEHVIAQIWLTPPAHTGLPPVFLDWPATQPPPEKLRLPAGSTVLALLQGTEDDGALRFGADSLAFKNLGGGSQRLEGKLTAGDKLSLVIDGRTVAQWPVAILADAVPAIAFTKPPQGDDSGRLRLTYDVSDDYGVAKAWATVRRLDAPNGEPLVFDLSVPTAGRAQARLSSRHDLTAHAWAGQPVTIMPTAQDGIGQTGSGEAVTLVLPERRFNHPVARAIIELRRRLDPAQPVHPEVLWGLDGIAARPQAFNDDTVAFLALRTARARLQHGPGAAAITSARDILWNTALRIEEGDKSMAERAMNEAAQALEKALAEGAPQEEIERLMDQLKQAMEQYLQALAEQAMRQGLQPGPMDPNAETVSPQELSEMMERMREMARLGSRESAAQMLQNLRQMLDNLQAGMQGQPDPRMQQAQKSLQQLGDLARQQRKLMDETFRQSQQGQQGRQAQQGRQGQQQGQQQGQTGQGQMGNQFGQMGAQAQDQLRRQLGEIMRQLGESMGDIPNALGSAEQAMRDATGQLSDNQLGAATESQGQALQHLQQGAEAAMQALSQQMQQGGQGFSGMQNGGGTRRDPMGRRMRDPLADDGSVQVPSEADLHRARDVLEELRRRAGQPQRPEAEKEYLRRLLRQF